MVKTPSFADESNFLHETQSIVANRKMLVAMTKTIDDYADSITLMM